MDMLVTGEIYHVLNRGIEDRVIFQNKRDYERFLLTIFECNSQNPARNRHRRTESIANDPVQIKADRLVDILCLTLMPNHFHIAAKQLFDGGIPKLMQRVGDSYTKYFNIKYERKGSLFMSGYKNVHVNSDSQLRHLIIYIHANPLDLIMPGWRAGKIKNFKKAKEFLENYIWSSYPLYSGRRDSSLISQIVNREYVDSFYPKERDHFNAICSWSNRYYETFNAPILRN
jgi:hypothetical protein